MDKRTWLFVLLTLGVWYVWLEFFAPVQVPDETETNDGAEDAQVDGGDGAPVDGAVPPVTAVPSETPEVPSYDVPVSLCRSVGEVETRTGALQAVRLLDYEEPFDVQPFWSWALTGFDGPWKPYGEPPGPEVVLSPNAWAATVGAGALTEPAPPVEVVTSSEGRLVTRALTPEGIEITRVLASEPGDPCRITVDVTWRNTGASVYQAGLWVGMHDVLQEQESRYALAMRPRALVDGGVEGHDDIEEIAEPEPLEGPVGWFGLADSYFGAFLVPVDGPAGRAVFTSVRGPSGALEHGVHYVLPAELAAGGTQSASYLLYLGPKQSSLLEAAHPSLEDAVELGWLSFVAWPLLWLLKFIHGFVGNWGVAIIVLTFVVKLLFFRLTQKSFESSQAMQAIQPQMTEIREKYKDNPEELNRRTFAMFQEAGVNPLGGCLPMVVQMPVWFALYSVLLSAVELYHTDFLYLRDLSAIDPYMILPAVVVVLMVVQQQMMPTANLDPAQAKMMKIMPVVFGFFFFTFPSGLVVYIFVNMVLSILQQWYIKRTFKGPAVQEPVS